MVTLKQYDKSAVQPTDDAVLYNAFMGVSAVIQGAECTIIGANQIRIATGRIVICGREVAIDDETVTANLSTSGDKQGRLILRIDMANTETPAYFTTQVGAPLPALVQEDINEDGLIYEFAMATYVCGELAISDIHQVSYRISQKNDYYNTPGIIEIWPGNTPPDGWLLCNGQAVSRTTYANLFSVLGTAYGQGDGSTTFNVPDVTGRVPVGANGTYPLAGKGGAADGQFALSEEAYAKIAITGGIEPGIFGAFYVSTPEPETEARFFHGGELESPSGTFQYGTPLGGHTDAGSLMQPYIAQHYIIKY